MLKALTELETVAVELAFDDIRILVEYCEKLVLEGESAIETL
jgi:hypothetical protein